VSDITACVTAVTLMPIAQTSPMTSDDSTRWLWYLLACIMTLGTAIVARLRLSSGAHVGQAMGRSFVWFTFSLLMMLHATKAEHQGSVRPVTHVGSDAMAVSMSLETVTMAATFAVTDKLPLPVLQPPPTSSDTATSIGAVANAAPMSHGMAATAAIFAVTEQVPLHIHVLQPPSIGSHVAKSSCEVAHATAASGSTATATVAAISGVMIVRAADQVSWTVRQRLGTATDQTCVFTRGCGWGTEVDQVSTRTHAQGAWHRADFLETSYPHCKRQTQSPARPGSGLLGTPRSSIPPGRPPAQLMTQSPERPGSGLLGTPRSSILSGRPPPQLSPLRLEPGLNLLGTPLGTIPPATNPQALQTPPPQAAHLSSRRLEPGPGLLGTPWRAMPPHTCQTREKTTPDGPRYMQGVHVVGVHAWRSGLLGTRPQAQAQYHDLQGGGLRVRDPNEQIECARPARAKHGDPLKSTNVTKIHTKNRRRTAHVHVATLTCQGMVSSGTWGMSTLGASEVPPSRSKIMLTTLLTALSTADASKSPDTVGSALLGTTVSMVRPPCNASNVTTRRRTFEVDGKVTIIARKIENRISTEDFSNTTTVAVSLTTTRATSIPPYLPSSDLLGKPTMSHAHTAKTAKAEPPLRCRMWWDRTQKIDRHTAECTRFPATMNMSVYLQVVGIISSGTAIEIRKMLKISHLLQKQQNQRVNDASGWGCEWIVDPQLDRSVRSCIRRDVSACDAHAKERPRGERSLSSRRGIACERGKRARGAALLATYRSA
jgi:hypothetical protein